MTIIATHELTPGPQPFSQQIYNGLDCCVTHEVNTAIHSLSNQASPIYAFERALQAPALEMMLRGWLIDPVEKERGIKLLKTDIAILESHLQQMAFAVWGKSLNARSPKQLLDFFYKELHLPEHWISVKGVRKLSTNRETLEKLELYVHARPIIACILAIRDKEKQCSVLETEIDPDGRLRTSYNIAGTETGRWSSSQSTERTGTNVQNLAPKLRKMFIADPGWKICAIDLEQAESREVGWIHGVLFDDWRYLDACYSGDLHTITARLVWPNFNWTGDLKKDRAIADQVFYREFSYRDMSKRGGHGCLTADHEVLTRNGWVSITEMPEEILTYSETKSEFSKVESWTNHLYTGTLQNFEGNSISAIMTHDHRVPYKKDQRYGLTEKLAETGPGTFMPLGNNYAGGSEIVPARLIAAFMADGHQKSTNRMEFHFHKPRKFSRLLELLQMYSYEYEIKEEQNKIIVVGGLPKKPGAFMLNWTKECIAEFIDEYKFWDGTIAPTMVTIYSSKKEDLEWLQTLGRIVGIGGVLSAGGVSGYGTQMYRLSQNHRLYASGVSVKHTKIPATDVSVYCPTVKSSWFYVRRNNKNFITGNTSYLGTAFTMSRHLKVPVKTMENFQASFLGAYPGFSQWHKWTRIQLQTTQSLTTAFGRERHFFGRPNDDTTLREAVAYVPQSSTADRLNLVLWRIWKHMGTRVRILAQVHDALYFLYREDDNEQELINKALSYFDIPMQHKNHKLVVPGEAKVGWNWATYDKEKNPDGLAKFKGSDTRTRGKINTILDMVM